LVLASIFTVSKQVESWRVGPVAGVIAGAVGAYVVVGLVPVETPNTWWFLFLSGMVAICAMVLPGISGAFILVLLGKYQYVLSAVTNRNFLTLFLVAAGAGVGIVTFAQVLGWLFKHHHDVTVSVLTGMLIGSLRKIWPWKETVEFMLDRHGDQVPMRQINVLPPSFDGQVILAIALAVAGCALILVLNSVASRKEKPQRGNAGATE
jgi:putative membrane protein